MRPCWILFIQFRAQIANLSWLHLQKTKTKVTVSGVEDDKEYQHPSKKAKSEESTSVDHIKALVESNKHLASQIETLANINHTSSKEFGLIPKSQPQYDKGGYKLNQQGQRKQTLPRQEPRPCTNKGEGWKPQYHGYMLLLEESKSPAE